MVAMLSCLPEAKELELDERDGDRQGEHQPADGRGIAKTELVKGQPGDVGNKEPALSPRAAPAAHHDKGYLKHEQ